MRLLVLILVVLNGAYFAWWHFQSPAPVVPSTPRATDTPSLTLLSERPPTAGTAGPVADAARAEALVRSIEDAGFLVTRRVLEQEEVAGYWVHLAPYSSRKQALAAARDLAEKGLKDYYVVGEGENSNAVSLGLFSEKFRAERRMEYVRSLGYAPELTPRYRTRQVFWLDYDEVGDQSLTESLWHPEGVADETALQRLVRNCSTEPLD